MHIAFQFQSTHMLLAEWLISIPLKIKWLTSIVNLNCQYSTKCCVQFLPHSGTTISTHPQSCLPSIPPYSFSCICNTEILFSQPTSSLGFTHVKVHSFCYTFWRLWTMENMVYLSLPSSRIVHCPRNPMCFTCSFLSLSLSQSPANHCSLHSSPFPECHRIRTTQYGEFCTGLSQHKLFQNKKFRENWFKV